MSSRRSFLVSSAPTAAASRSVVGANDKVRVGFIGAGTRGSYMASVAEKHEDCQILAMCDVYGKNLDNAVSRLKVSKPDTYVDYRRIMDRKDLDAVYIATPDHWHSPMIVEAAQAGKDAYCEKPLSNSIEAAVKAVDAVKQYNRVVQIGLQQRSWDHFQICAELVQSGMFGTIFHCQLHWSGTYTRAAGGARRRSPSGLDWELFQGPAPRHPFSPESPVLALLLRLRRRHHHRPGRAHRRRGVLVHEVPRADQRVGGGAVCPGAASQPRMPAGFLPDFRASTPPS